MKEAARIIREQVEAEEKKEFDEMVELMTEFAGDMGTTIFMPHVMDSAMKKTTNNARNHYLVPRTRKVVEVTAALLSALEKKLDKPINEDFKNYIEGKEVLAVLWSGDPGADVESDLEKFVREVSDPVRVDFDASSENGDEGSIMEIRILDELIVYLDESDHSELDFSNKEESTAGSFRMSVAASVDERSRNSQQSHSVKSEVVERPKIVIPPVWTPKSKEVNCLIMFTLFRNVSEYLKPS